MASTRTQRVSRLLREELSRIIREEMNDPRLGMISITEVEVQKDLRQAKIHISAFGDEDQQQISIGVLERAASFLRGELSRQLDLRHTPELLFQLDKSLERGSRVFDLLHKAKENAPVQQEEAAETEEHHE